MRLSPLFCASLLSLLVPLSAGPLHEAIRRNDVAECSIRSANINELSEPDILGRFPLHLAAQLGLVTIVKLFLDYNDDVNRIDSFRETPLHYAVRGNYPHANTKDHAEVIRLLLSKGASIDAQNTGGNTALHLAARHGHEVIIEVLLEGFPNLELENIFGEKASEIALKNVRSYFPQSSGSLLSQSAPSTPVEYRAPPPAPARRWPFGRRINRTTTETNPSQNALLRFASSGRQVRPNLKLPDDIFK